MPVYGPLPNKLKFNLPQVKDRLIHSIHDDEEKEEEEEGDLMPMDLDSVINIRSKHLGRELPTFSPYAALEELISIFKGSWQLAAEDCLEQVKSLLHNVTTECVHHVFEQFPEMRSKVK